MLEQRLQFICHVMFDCYVFFVFTVSPPPILLSPEDPAATVDYTAAAHDYVVDDRSTTIELPGKQSHFPSPTYRLLFYIYLLH